MHKYIKQAAEDAQKDSKEQVLGKIPVLVKNDLPEGFDLRAVLDSVSDILPKVFFENVDVIYIGEFEELQARQLNALYDNGAIYISNTQDGEQDLLDDIVHEFAHAAEKTFAEMIYSDDLVRREFLGKRQRLFDILKSEGYKISHDTAMNYEYAEEFDQFLFQEVGYPTLETLTMGLFVSPYAATSLREYFANGFEQYFLGGFNYVQKISPQLFFKVAEITNYNREE